MGSHKADTGHSSEHVNNANSNLAHSGVPAIVSPDSNGSNNQAGDSAQLHSNAGSRVRSDSISSKYTQLSVDEPIPPRGRRLSVSVGDSRSRESSRSKTRAQTQFRSIFKSLTRDISSKDTRHDSVSSQSTTHSQYPSSNNTSDFEASSSTNSAELEVRQRRSSEQRNIEPLEGRRVRSIRSPHKATERSRSPSFRKLKLFPALATLVPGIASTATSSSSSPNNNSQETGSSGTKGQVYSRLLSSEPLKGPSKMSVQEVEAQRTTHRPSTSTISTNRSIESLYSEVGSHLETNSSTNTNVKRVKSWSASDSTINESLSTAGNISHTEADHSLRHAELPAGPEAETVKEKPCFLRVYKADGTFGTILCPIDTTGARLLQLAARKFFIANANDYHLVILCPNRVRNLTPDAKPGLLIRDLLILAGFGENVDCLNETSREDISFLCRVVMCNINEPLRPPLLAQSSVELFLTDTDVSDAPTLTCGDPRSVETLDLSGSGFQGTSVDFPKLRNLMLSRMTINGVSTISQLVPSYKSLLVNLTFLDLSGNGFSTLNDLDLKVAPNLRHLDLRGNNLSCLPNSLVFLPFLEILCCGTNSLTEFQYWNPSLVRLDFSYNLFKELSLLPQEAIQMVNLESLRLCGNLLTVLPESISLLPNLVELDVRHNKITNPMNSTPLSLQRLVASYNNPRHLEHSDSSSSFRNIHEKTRESSVPNVSDLRLAGLHSLVLHDTFSLNSVTNLDLTNTHMPFIHESLFENAPNIQVLNLSHNSLTSLPSSVGSLQYLEDFSVADNLLTELPYSLFELPELKVLDAHFNNLKMVPSNFLQAPKLRQLNLASNLLTTLPETPVTSFSLIQLVLTDNQLLEDSLDTVMQLTGLHILDLGYNFLTELPPGLFSQLPALEELYLGGNRLPTLPHDDFANATQLRILNVNANKLHVLPAELSKATKLEALDAGANQLRYNVANWPFDWNWRWNKKLQYLNFSSNKRLEISKSLQYIDEETGTVDLADFCVLPNLTTLGLMDVTLTTNSIPFQSHSCRIRAFGSEVNTNFRVGIADSLGFRPLANNDLVIEQFRNREDESLVAMFDGHNESPGQGNKISHLAQEAFATILKRELNTKNVKTDEALRRAFLRTHRDIGNIAQLNSEEIAHTFIGQISNTASSLSTADWSSGTGATVLYFQGSKLYIATTGGARVLLSRANGIHSVLSKPLPPVGAELDRIRRSGGVVDPAKSLINEMCAYPRLIGCFTEGAVFSACPSIYEYDMTNFEPTDQIIIGSCSLWDVMRHETAADIARSCSHDPVLSALKLRDFGTAYGSRDRMMVMVIGKPKIVNEAIRRQVLSSETNEEGPHSRKSRHTLTEDSIIARFGSEISPPFGDVTMVFTDIKSSTYLWENYSTLMQAAIKTHNNLMRKSIRAMDGYEVKNEGDAFIVSFHTPVKALIWSLTVQKHLLTAEWPPELLEVDICRPVEDEKGVVLFRGLSVRMGIHCGRPVAEPDPVTHRMDYFGPMVNRASRISGIARGGQISVSSDLLKTINRDLEAHKKVLDGVPLAEAYFFTSESNAIMLERSAEVLKHTKYVVKELGELKLRGIENYEHIYNVYPASLVSRHLWYDQNSAGSQLKRDSHGLSSDHPIAMVQQRGSETFKMGGGLDTSSVFSRNPSIDPLSPSIQMGSFSQPPSLGAVPSEVIGRRPSGTSIVSMVSSGQAPSSDRLTPSERDEGYDNMSTLPSASEGFGSLTQDTASSIPVGPSTDPIQALAIRLEAVCNAISGGMNLADTQHTLNIVEPKVVAGSDIAVAARPLWITRIENAIARLQQLNNWP